MSERTPEQTPGRRSSGSGGRNGGGDAPSSGRSSTSPSYAEGGGAGHPRETRRPRRDRERKKRDSLGTKKAKALERAARLYDDAADRDARSKAAIHELRDKELAACTFKPRMSLGSEAILKQREERERAAEKRQLALAGGTPAHSDDADGSSTAAAAAGDAAAPADGDGDGAAGAAGDEAGAAAAGAAPSNATNGGAATGAAGASGTPPQLPRRKSVFDRLQQDAKRYSQQMRRDSFENRAVLKAAASGTAGAGARRASSFRLDPAAAALAAGSGGSSTRGAASAAGSGGRGGQSAVLSSGDADAPKAGTLPGGRVSKGSAKGGDVFSALHKQASVYEKRRSELLKKRNAEQGVTFRPSLVSRGDAHAVSGSSVVVSGSGGGAASAASRGGRARGDSSVFDRLFAHASRHVQTVSARQKELDDKAKADKEAELGETPLTKAKFALSSKHQRAKDAIKSMSPDERRRHAKDSADRLYEAAVRQHKRLEEMRSAAPDGCTFQPDTQSHRGKSSNGLVSAARSGGGGGSSSGAGAGKVLVDKDGHTKVGNRLYDDAVRRVQRAAELRARSPSGAVGSEENCTFHPMITKKALKIAKRRTDGADADVGQRLYAAAMRQHDRAEAARKKPPEECTFSPETNSARAGKGKGGGGPVSGSGGGGGGGGVQPPRVPSREEREQARRRLYDGETLQRLARDKERKRVEREMAECTFRPNVKRTAADTKKYEKFHAHLMAAVPLSAARRASEGDASEAAAAASAAALDAIADGSLERAAAGEGGAPSSTGALAGAGAGAGVSPVVPGTRPRSVFDKLYADHARRQMEQRKKHAKQVASQLSGATFQPDLAKSATVTSTALATTSSPHRQRYRQAESRRGGKDADPFERLYANAVLRAAQKERDAKVAEIQGCTFRPDINPHVPDFATAHAVNRTAREQRLAAMYESGAGGGGGGGRFADGNGGGYGYTRASRAGTTGSGSDVEDAAAFADGAFDMDSDGASHGGGGGGGRSKRAGSGGSGTGTGNGRASGRQAAVAAVRGRGPGGDDAAAPSSLFRQRHRDRMPARRTRSASPHGTAANGADGIRPSPVKTGAAPTGTGAGAAGAGAGASAGAAGAAASAGESSDAHSDSGRSDTRSSVRSANSGFSGWSGYTETTDKSAPGARMEERIRVRKAREAAARRASRRASGGGKGGKKGRRRRGAKRAGHGSAAAHSSPVFIAPGDVEVVNADGSPAQEGTPGSAAAAAAAPAGDGYVEGPAGKGVAVPLVASDAMRHLV